MAKKLICFPFVDGDLQEFSYNDLDDSEREKVYAEGILIKDYFHNPSKQEIWKPNEEVELTLHYKSYGRGRSSVTFYWLDDNGHKYPMFLTDLDELLKLKVDVSNLHGIFTYVKRGRNYGIKLLKKLDESIEV